MEDLYVSDTELDNDQIYTLSIYDEEKFICQDCSPSGVDSSVASPAPATVQPVQCSLEERSDISPEQDTQPLSGEHWFKP